MGALRCSYWQSRHHTGWHTFSSGANSPCPPLATAITSHTISSTINASHFIIVVVRCVDVGVWGGRSVVGGSGSDIITPLSTPYMDVACEFASTDQARRGCPGRRTEVDGPPPPHSECCTPPWCGRQATWGWQRRVSRGAGYCSSLPQRKQFPAWPITYRGIPPIMTRCIHGCGRQR